MPRTLILCVLASASVGCGGPSSRNDHITSDGGAPADCSVDTGSGSGSSSGSGACGGSGLSFDQAACASCLIANVPAAPLCGDVQPGQLEAAATACGAASYTALGSGSFACARSLAWATVYGAGVAGNALAVDSACTASQAAGAGQAACLGAVGVVSAGAGFAQPVIDMLNSCPSTIGPACVLARDVRDKLMIARAAVAAFRSALPAETASQDISDWVATVALGPVADGLLRSRFPVTGVGAALDDVAVELQDRADALNGAITQLCL